MIFVILPAFNEEAKIGEVLNDIASSLKRLGADFRILLVNDGSTDGTLAVAKGLCGGMPLTVIDHGVNKGVHEAFRSGFKAASSAAKDGDIIFTMDADGTHDVGKIPDMIDRINGGCDIVIASRYRPGSKIVGVPMYRNFLSYAARFVVSLVFNEWEARDFTIFHRAYKAKILKGLLEYYAEGLIESPGFTSNTEVLIKARRRYGKGLRICEVPCELHYELKAGQSKMKVFKNIMEYFRFIWRIKARGRPIRRY